jgi:hypothetical protein
MPATVIWVSDLLASMNALAPTNDSTIEAIAHLLGLERTAMSLAQPSLPEQKTRPAAVIDAAMSTSVPVASPSFPVERLPLIAPRTTPTTRRNTVVPLQLTAVVSHPPPMPVPLLSPLAGRFIVQELVSSSRFGPELNIDRLIDILARYEIPQPVPLQECRTLARGAQVLVDDGEGMDPFSDDQQGLVELVRRLVGEALVDVRTIHEVPDPADPVDPWVPPPPGTPVLALTDLGLAGRTERGALGLTTARQSVASTLGMRGSSLIALVPYPATRWPVQLRPCIHLVNWDRSTTIAHARQAQRARSVK